MLNILNAEFRKFFKTKTFIALTILTIVFPLFTSGMYKVLEAILSSNEFVDTEGFVNAFTIFTTSFNPMQNYGLLLLIFILVLVINDFTQNTIRNKLIAGYDRVTIFLAQAIFAITIMVIFISLYAFLNYFLVGIFISFGSTSALEIFKFYILNITSLIVVYSYVMLISFIFKRFGATMGIVLGTIFVVMIAYSIISIGIKEESRNLILNVVPFLQLFNAFIILDTNILVAVIVNLAYIAGLLGLGIYTVKKTDFK